MKEILYSQGDPDLKISVRNKNVVFVGKYFKKRAFIHGILVIHRAFVQKEVNGATDLLITDDSSEYTQRMKKAKEFGVKIMRYQEVFK